MSSTNAIRSGRAFVELFADDSQLVRGLRRAEAKLKAFGARVGALGKKMATLGAAVAAPLAMSAKHFADAGSQMWDMAKRTGVSVEALSGLKYAAEQSGSSVDALENGLRRMQRTIYDAGKGTATQVDALKDLGLTYNDLANLSPEEQFRRMADRINGIEDPTRKAALAMMMFGRSGTQLLPMIEGGAAALDGYIRRAREIGIIMSTQDAQAADAFGDALADLWKTVKMGVFQVGAALAPAIQEVTEKITRIAAQIAAWVKANQNLIVTVAKVAGAVLAGGVALMAFGGMISGLGSILGGLVSVITTVGVAFKTLGVILGAILSPIGLLVASVAALGGYLIYASGAGGEALSWLGEKFSKLAEDAKKAFGGIADALAAGDIALAAQILWGTLKLWWMKGTEGLRRIWIDFKAGFVKIFAEAFYGGLKAARKVWEWLEIGWSETTAFFATAWHSFVGFFQKSWERIKAAAQKAWNWIKSLFDDSIDLEVENKLVEQEKQKALAKIDSEQAQKIVERDEKRQAERKQIDNEANDFYARQDAEKRLLQQAADDVAAQEQAALTKQIADLKKQRDDALDEARRKRTGKSMADGSPSKRLEGPDAMLAKARKALAGAGSALQKQTEVRGTFNTAALQGLQGSDSTQKKMADDAEKTRKNIEQLKKFIVDLHGMTQTFA